jgi:hypothetical protein
MLENEPKELFEKLYTPAEVAKLWSVSPDWIRRRFVREPGVLILSVPKAGKRQYSVIRIPATVVARVTQNYLCRIARSSENSPC